MATDAGPGRRACLRRRVTWPEWRPSAPSSSTPRNGASACSPSTPSAARTGSAPARRSRRSSAFWTPPSGTRRLALSSRACGSAWLAAWQELPVETRASIEQAILSTAGGARMTLNVAFNYSSRSEIVDAVRAYVDDGNDLSQLDEGGPGRLPLHGGPARPGPAHPHRRRPAHQQLPALAGGLRGALLLRTLLAGLRSR